MGHDQEIVKQLQRHLRDWNPNKPCRSHSYTKCCNYRSGRLGSLHLCNLDLEQPPSELENLSALQELNLSNNRLSTLPAELGNLSALQELNLSNNWLSTLPAELENLSALQELNLSNNRLSTLPAELGNLSALRDLNLSNNRLSTLPAELGSLSALQYLDLSNNRLSTLPAELENLSSLKRLELKNNPSLPSFSSILEYSSYLVLTPDYTLNRMDLRHYLHALPTQPSNQLADRSSLSENALVSPQDVQINLSKNVPTSEKGAASTKEMLPLRIFYCYAHEDKDLRDRIDKHLGTLKRLGQVVGWYDREIQAGTEWEREIEENLGTAHIILLLVSADFVASEYCYGVEMQRALELHEKGEAHVLPILLRPVDWQDAPFAKLQLLPTGAKPITRWSDPEEALEDVARQIRAVVTALRT